MNSKKILAVNLKKYRQENRISQEELAARAELSTRVMGKLNVEKFIHRWKLWTSWLVLPA